MFIRKKTFMRRYVARYFSKEYYRKHFSQHSNWLKYTDLLSNPAFVLFPEKDIQQALEYFIHKDYFEIRYQCQNNYVSLSDTSKEIRPRLTEYFQDYLDKI